MAGVNIPNSRKAIQEAMVDSLRLGIATKSDVLFGMPTLASLLCDEVEDLRSKLADLKAKQCKKKTS